MTRWRRKVGYKLKNSEFSGILYRPHNFKLLAHNVLMPVNVSHKMNDTSIFVADITFEQFLIFILEFFWADFYES